MTEEGKRAALTGHYSGLEVDGPPSGLPAGQHPPHHQCTAAAHARHMPAICHPYCLIQSIWGTMDELRKGLNPGMLRCSQRETRAWEHAAGRGCSAVAREAGSVSR